MEETRHIPVLLQEAVDALQVKPGDTVVDATLGGGSHASAILRLALPGGKLIAFDTDADALERFRTSAQSDAMLRRAIEERALVLVHKNYSLLGGVLEQEGIGSADAILADLGFSSDQIEEAERGLSFQKEGPLDMRLDRTAELTAENIVNTFSEAELEKIFRTYGEETEARRIARAIVAARANEPLRTTRELAELIETAYPKAKRYRMKIHPATRIFQALRIAVNQEFEHLEKFLAVAAERLAHGGRLAVITFHSGEDRIVKQFFRDRAQGCICPPGFPVCRCDQKPDLKILTKKPIVPNDREIEANPRARSAKLRIAEKI